MNKKLLLLIPILVVGFLAGCSKPLVTGIVQNVQDIPDPNIQLVKVNDILYVHDTQNLYKATIGDCVTCYSYENDIYSRCQLATGCTESKESITGNAICKEKYNLTFDKLVGDTLYCKNPPAQKEEAYDGITVVLPN